MEGKITKRISDNIKEKPKVFNKKRDEEEKDRTSETVTMDSNATTEQCLGSIIVVGKSCNIKSKVQQSTHELHECHSETTLGQISGNENSEAVESVVLPSGSHTSFISAQSDVSIGNKELKSTEGVENLQEGNLLQLENSFSTCVHSEGFDSFSTGGNCLSRIENLELNLAMKRIPLSELNEQEKELALIEIRYEEDVLILMKEFEKEVGKLNSGVEFEATTGEWEEDARERYITETGKIREYFFHKHTDLEKKYYGIYDTFDKKRLNSILERKKQDAISCFHKIIEMTEGKVQEIQLESFVNNLLDKYTEEIKSIRNKYQKNLIDHASEMGNIQTVIELLRTDLKTGEFAALTECRSQIEVFKSESKKELEENEKDEEEIVKIKLLPPENSHVKVENSPENTCSLKEESETVNDKLTNKDSNIIFRGSQNNSGKTETNCYSKMDRANPEYVSDHEAKMISLLDETQESEISNISYCRKSQMETDDDKLQITQERDSLKEMLASLRLVVTNLLNFLGQCKDLNNISADFNGEETLYRSLHINTGQNEGDNSFVLKLSNIVQDINDTSLLNSSEHVRFELEKCLKQLKDEATELLQLSKLDVSSQLTEIIRKFQKQKDDLKQKVETVEKTHKVLKEEMEKTKHKFAEWERNLEVVSEGYGEEVMEPKKITSIFELKNKIKMFMAEHSMSQLSQEVNVMEEIWKEGYRLQEEWKKEKIDLEQQIDVADKQLHSLRKFMEEQAAEREQEREAFDREIATLKEILKTKEREGFIQSRTNCENQSVEALEAQVKDLTTQLNNMESSKKSVEIEFQNAVKKIWSLREVIQDLEVQLATVNEKETGLRRKIEEFDALLEEQNKIHADLKNELELCKTEKETQYSNYIKILEEERHTLHRIADQVNPEVLSQMKMRLRQIESMLIKKTKELEMVHVASTNVSCSSPSEDISVRDQWDATRCSTPDEMYENELRNMCLPMEEVDRLHDRLTRHTRAEEIALKYIRDLKMQLKNNRKACEELETERDLLLERADQHLKENSTLKARLEEQRCNAILQQKQLNVDLECQIKRLEIELEKLNDLCQQKDKQLYDLNEVLENTSKTLSEREAEALNRSKEENALISALKTDLENAISVREKLEENLEKMKGKLQNSLKMPALLDSMLEEKNAEIDRLEKEVLRLSTENSSFLTSSKELPEQSKPLKNGKRIKFSEPESFGDCISIISPYNPSVIRYCGDSFADFRNSSFKIQQPNQHSKPESLSSIGPLQLSPRGFGINNNWKTSSPVMPSHESLKIATGSSSLEESRFLAVIESKQRETSELKLEIDTYKRQLVERMQELDLAKKRTMVIEQELEAKVEEITQLKNTETHMTLTMDSLKRNHSEEVEELKNKLNFERGKVEKVYEEIKILEVKKIEIEEAFYSLKEDYREKLEGEQKKIKTLTEKIKDLEIQNAHSEKAYADAREEMKNVVEESKEAMKILCKQLTDLKRENDDLMLTSKNFENAEVQVDIPCTRNCRNIINISIPDLANNSNSSLNDNFETLTIELEKMTKTITETEFKRCDALAYMQKIKALVSMIFININDVMSEVENQKKKLMETSVDELTDKVERELLLSAKLDNELLSSIEAKGFQSRSLAMNNTQTRSVIVVSDGSDFSTARGNQKNEKDCCSISDKAHLDSISKISELEKEKDDLIRKIKDNERVIKCLENNLMTEKERCREDAKIMELLRVNLEKGLQDIKSKDKVLRREMQIRMKLEKELEALKKMSESLPEIRVIDLVSDQVRSQEEKLMSVAKNLDSEKIKNQELRLLLEQNKMERISEKEALRLLECDFNLLKEQKENFKTELLKAKLLLHSRERQINHLKRKVNLQEIDIKALSLSNDIHRVKILHESTASSGDNDEMEMREHKNDSFVRQGVSKSLLQKMKKLNICIERHIQESNEMGEALLYLSEETGQMRDLIKALEENTEVKVNDDTLVADSDLERKLWNLEREKLLKDMETVRCEKELAQRESLETSKTNELLKQENYKLKTEVKLLEKEASSHIEMGVVKDRMSHLLRKYLRAESYRKALIWQKQYLTVSLNSYRSSEETLKKLGKSGSRKKDGKVKSGRPRKFRVITLAVSAIFRMKFIVKRWQRHKSFPTSELPLQSTKETLPASLLSRDNDPGTALSYQSHNSCRQSSTRVLKTPPSRDPGLQRNISDVLQFENYGRQHEPLGTANVLP